MACNSHIINPPLLFAWVLNWSIPTAAVGASFDLQCWKEENFWKHSHWGPPQWIHQTSLMCRVHTGKWLPRSTEGLGVLCGIGACSCASFSRGQWEPGGGSSQVSKLSWGSGDPLPLLFLRSLLWVARGRGQHGAFWKIFMTCWIRLCGHSGHGQNPTCLLSLDACRGPVFAQHHFLLALSGVTWLLVLRIVDINFCWLVAIHTLFLESSGLFLEKKLQAWTSGNGVWRSGVK